MAFSPDRRRIYVTTVYGERVQVLNLDSGKVRGRWRRR
jgi:hypothetical protein